MAQRQDKARTIETNSSGATRPPPGAIPADAGLQGGGETQDSSLDDDEIELIGELGNELDDLGDGPSARSTLAPPAVGTALFRGPVVAWLGSRARRAADFLAARERPCDPWDTKRRVPDAVWIKLFEDEIGAFSKPIPVLDTGALSASPKAPGSAAKPADFAAAKTARVADFAGRARIAVLSESPEPAPPRPGRKLA